MYNEDEINSFKNQTMIIYKVTNLINNKVYIGQTTRTFNERYSGKGVGAERILYSERSNSHLINSMCKYGVKNFKVEIIDQCNTEEELNKREMHYINLYDSTNYNKGYNFCQGGNGGKRRISKEQRINTILRRVKDCKEKTLLAYLKKMSKAGIEDYEILEEMLDVGIFVEWSTGKVTWYKSLSHFKKEEDIKLPITKLHCLLKQRSNKVYNNQYKINTQNYKVYDERIINLFSINVVNYAEKRQRRLNQNVLNKVRYERILSLYSEKLKLHGEWGEWETQDYSKRAGYVVNEDKFNEFAEDVTNSLKEVDEDYYKTHCQNMSSEDVVFFLGRVFRNKLYRI